MTDFERDLTAHADHTAAASAHQAELAVSREVYAKYYGATSWSRFSP